MLVLGASGFIGCWVARVLCAQGAQVFLGVRNRTTAKKVFSEYGIRGRICEVDLGLIELIPEFYQRIKPSITFNLAGYGVDKLERNEEALYLINSQLVKAVCEAAAETEDPAWSGQAIVHTGSALEYGDIGGDLCEDSMPNPTTPYGKSKLAGTCYLTRSCESYQIRGLTARLFTVYGPGEHNARLLPSLLKTAKTGESLDLTAGRQRRDFTYVADVAEGLLRLGVAVTKPGDVVNLATGRLAAVRTFAETAAGILRIPSEKLKFGTIPTAVDEMAHSAVSVEHLRHLTGWTPPTRIAEGIGKTKEFAAKHVE